MNLPWITINKRLLEAIKIINSIPLEDFTQILTQTVESPTEPFSESDLHSLESQLSLSPDEIQLLVQSIAHIYKKSLKILIKPTVLQKHLTDNLHFDADRAEEFVKTWTKVTKDDFGDVDKHKKVDNVSWELNLETHSSDVFIEGDAVPKGRLHLALSDFNSANAENITLEMNEGELLEMYRTLENIQNNLDVFNACK